MFDNLNIFDFLGKPGRPGAPIMLDNQDLHLLVQWSEGDTGNTPLSEFILQYRSGGFPENCFAIRYYMLGHIFCYT